MRLDIPFTSGVLIGIGETGPERIESLLALRDLHNRHGHLQEIIIQPLRPKPGTSMSAVEEAPLVDLLATAAIARIAFGPEMNIQSPPNLCPHALPDIIDAGINDWGGISPVTPDFVNPEAEWPNIAELAEVTRQRGKVLTERLPIYPRYALDASRWLGPSLRTPVLRAIDAEGFARTGNWAAGASIKPPPLRSSAAPHAAPDAWRVSKDITAIVARAFEGTGLRRSQIVRLFGARGDDLLYVCRSADLLRFQVVGETVTYVVNRNINYTNICSFGCTFCAFSKAIGQESLRERPYVMDLQEIAERAVEAWNRGATEVCMQGGIHPDYTGDTYIEICRAVKSAVPQMHIHAFSPLEIWQGAATLGLSIRQFLTRLRDVGLGTLPGTAAEILHDEVRRQICPDKLDSAQWVRVMQTAHELGIKTTATIMHGHCDHPRHWAHHLLKIRSLQARTKGFTEFVPLPFVHMLSPIYRRGQARKGPTIREALLMHAVVRLALHPLIENIQVSWVKMGADGAAMCLQAGANDLGGTLMNESISRAAGASHGQEMDAAAMAELIHSIGRTPQQRTTTYDKF